MGGAAGAAFDDHTVGVAGGAGGAVPEETGLAPAGQVGLRDQREGSVQSAMQHQQFTPAMGSCWVSTWHQFLGTQGQLPSARLCHSANAAAMPVPPHLKQTATLSWEHTAQFGSALSHATQLLSVARPNPCSWTVQQGAPQEGRRQWQPCRLLQTPCRRSLDLPCRCTCTAAAMLKHESKLRLSSNGPLLALAHFLQKPSARQPPAIMNLRSQRRVAQFAAVHSAHLPSLFK